MNVCRNYGTACDLANENGYCIITGCIRRKYSIFSEAIPKPNRNLVEVVRCKDCKLSESVITSWSTDGKNSRMERLCKVHKWSVKDDDFCSYGTRKTNTITEKEPTPIRDYMVYGERKESE